MHELSLAQSIMDIVQNAATVNGSKRVMAIGVRVGELSGVVVESLTFCFSAITAGTPLEGAVLQVTRVPVRAECKDCRAVSEISNMVFLCPSCGKGNLNIIAGRELQVSHIEVDEEPGEKP